jgi:hypothetical protein
VEGGGEMMTLKERWAENYNLIIDDVIIGTIYNTGLAPFVSKVGAENIHLLGKDGKLK